MIKNMEQFSYEERLNKLGLFCLQNRQQGIDEAEQYSTVKSMKKND